MADDVDISTERDEKLLAARIENARRVIPIQNRPILGCEPCSDMAQERAKYNCVDYKNCLADWEKVQRLNKIEGK